VTAMTTSYHEFSFRARSSGSDGAARSLASDDSAGELGARVSGRDVVAAWLAAPLLGALCLSLLAH